MSCVKSIEITPDTSVSITTVFETNTVLHCLHLHAVLGEHQQATSSKQPNGTGSLQRAKKTPPPRPVPLGLGRRRRWGLAQGDRILIPCNDVDRRWREIRNYSNIQDLGFTGFLIMYFYRL